MIYDDLRQGESLTVMDDQLIFSAPFCRLSYQESWLLLTSALRKHVAVYPSLKMTAIISSHDFALFF